jgi:hypothetical protein
MVLKSSGGGKSMQVWRWPVDLDHRETRITHSASSPRRWASHHEPRLRYNFRANPTQGLTFEAQPSPPKPSGEGSFLKLSGN